MKRIVFVIMASLVLSACQTDVQETPEQIAITSVYNINIKAITGSKSAAEVVAKLQSIRLNACPAFFVDAYRDYIKAWEKLADVEKKMYAINMQKAVSDMSDFMSDFVSKPQEAIVVLKKKWPTLAADIDQANNSITKAFANLQLAGARYNAVYE